MTRPMINLLRNGAVAVLVLAGSAARADSVDTLKSFVRDVKSGRASFTQVVTAQGGAKKKGSVGVFEFERPNRFRFDYMKPYEQNIVADGSKVWLYDADLNQVLDAFAEAALDLGDDPFVERAVVDHARILARQPLDPRAHGGVEADVARGWRGDRRAEHDSQFRRADGLVAAQHR